MTSVRKDIAKYFSTRTTYKCPYCLIKSSDVEKTPADESEEIGCTASSDDEQTDNNNELEKTASPDDEQTDKNNEIKETAATSRTTEIANNSSEILLNYALERIDVLEEKANIKTVKSKSVEDAINALKCRKINVKNEKHTVQSADM
ncbi:hypothetical protein SNEBB_010554 [Seison nebaliae]|nr:hypothetical protein SNEBB_010554 [Seison nebaliae]